MAAASTILGGIGGIATAATALMAIAAEIKKCRKSFEGCGEVEGGYSERGIGGYSERGIGSYSERGIRGYSEMERGSERGIRSYSDIERGSEIDKSRERGLRSLEEIERETTPLIEKEKSGCLHIFKNLLKIYFQIIFAFIIPPLSVWLVEKSCKPFCINLCLTMCFYFPGVIHAFITIYENL